VYHRENAYFIGQPKIMFKPPYRNFEQMPPYEKIHPPQHNFAAKKEKVMNSNEKGKVNLVHQILWWGE